MGTYEGDFDVTHVFNFNGIYDFPFGKGQKFLNSGGLLDRIVGGWELSSIVSWTSGAPITFVDTRGTLNRTAGPFGNDLRTNSLQTIDEAIGLP